MKRAIALILIIMTLSFTIVLASCTDTTDSENAEIVSLQGFEKNGTTFETTVEYTQEVVVFSNLIEVSPNATYMVSTDIEGRNQIPTGNSILQEGENVFYILVTSGSGTKKTQYTIKIDKEEPPKCNITLDLAGGAYLNGESTSITIRVDKEINALPTPTYEGYNFAGWLVDGEKIEFPYLPAEDKTITASWVEKPKVMVTIYLDANGGQLGEGVADELPIELDTEIGELPTPMRDGYTFLGWYEDGNERWEVDRRTKAEYDMEAVALWEANEYTVTFNVESYSTLVGVSYINIPYGQSASSINKSMPTATREDYVFMGWQDENGNEFTKFTIVDCDIALTPIWKLEGVCIDGTENHQWLSWQVTSEPTCTEAGMVSRICMACGETETKQTGAPLGHDEYLIEKVSATCQEEGFDKYGCYECDTTWKENVTGPIGHAFEHTETVKATCLSGGYDIYSCQGCGATEERNKTAPDFSPNGHNYELTVKEPTCTRSGYKDNICTLCGAGDGNRETIPALGHTYEREDYDGTTGKVIDPETGIITYYCQDCEHSEIHVEE